MSASNKKSAAAAPKGKKDSFKKTHTSMFAMGKREVGLGRQRPRVDLTHFVKWPLYIRLQRQRAILNERVKVPAAINQFNDAISKDQAATLFSVLVDYKPETVKEKRQRLLQAAAAKAQDGAATATTKPVVLKYGLNHITTLVESKKAKLVAIAHDVNPIELVVWLPTLCRKMGVPFCIVKGKARLGRLVNKKTASVVALTEVKPAHANKFEQLVTAFKAKFDVPSKKYGGGKLPARTLIKEAKAAKIAKAQLANKPEAAVLVSKTMLAKQKLAAKAAAKAESA